MAAEPATLRRLAEIAAATQSVSVVGDDVAIEDLEHDSRAVGPGAAFIALRGATSDGHEFAATAVANGAAALVVEERLDYDVPQLIVEDSRKLMASLAAEVHGRPADALTIVGLTGTNGKTTVTHMLAAIADAAGIGVGLIGTVGARIGNRPHPLRHTTPEATELQRILREMVDGGVRLVAMEVSSHALAYGRADGIHFDLAGFTNLSQDHLDFHKDMEDYYLTKRSLFDPGRSDAAVVFVDDQWGARLAGELSIPITTVGFDTSADVHAAVVAAGPGGTTLVIHAPSAVTFTVVNPLAGSFNAENALMAAACALEIGIAPESIETGLRSMPPVPGRFEAVDAGQNFTVIIDYAHTPDAIEAVIEAMRPLTAGRIVAVGGAGGDRDRSKRPLMGAALARGDVAILTSDNPRSENPEAILNQMADGVTGRDVTIEPDRRTAIHLAIATAAEGDVVLILGKGHEQGQQIGDTLLPFDDREVALEALAEMAPGNSR